VKKEEAPAAPTTRECPHCLSRIPIKATRCPHCTSQLQGGQKAVLSVLHDAGQGPSHRGKHKKNSANIRSGGAMASRLMWIKGLVMILLVLSLGCQSVYYAAWEKLGKEKRHLLSDQVENAREEQQEASEQFKDVLTRIKTLYGFEGGDLEDAYEKLKADYPFTLFRCQWARLS
jgi:hypothetical protein